MHQLRKIRTASSAATHREQEEELCELSLAEEVGQELHGIVTQH
jgi:hypothetical protein